MVTSSQSHSRPVVLRRLFPLLTAISFLFFTECAIAHPMPNSIVLMDVKSNGVAMEIQLPVGELQLAMGRNIDMTTNGLSTEERQALRKYILSHINAVSTTGKTWMITLNDITVDSAQQDGTGLYQELKAQLWMSTPEATNPRQFTLIYDVIVHQVVTHKILVSLRQDWESGVTAEHPVDVGVIELDTRNNVVPAFSVNLSKGSKWKGFISMVNLGINHIQEGTDHLLFLLTLLLPAPLLVQRKRWAMFGGVRHSLLRLLKIVTAFTIGHSVTLLFGSLGWIKLPSAPVEILIAFSILVSAVHAMHPVFPGKEIFVAGGFGLVHGMAFASTLSDLNLDAGPMALSILGFNIGIELMQLLVIAVSFPWLIILSRTSWYTPIRNVGASLAAIAAVAWIVQQVMHKDNVFTTGVEVIAQQSTWIAIALALTALLSFWLAKTQPK